MKSELLDLQAQTSHTTKFGDEFLQAIYFTVTTSLPTLHLKKDLWKSICFLLRNKSIRKDSSCWTL